MWATDLGRFEVKRGGQEGNEGAAGWVRIMSLGLQQQQQRSQSSIALGVANGIGNLILDSLV